jgi:hypothetical protein
MLLANQKKEIFIVTHIIIPYTSILELKNKCLIIIIAMKKNCCKVS